MIVRTAILCTALALPGSCSPGPWSPEPPPEAELLAPAGTAWELGDFVVTTGGVRVDVRHRSEPDRPVFASPASGAWANLGRAAVTADEHQGSFRVDEGIERMCSDAAPVEVRMDGAELLVRTRFADCDGAVLAGRIRQDRPGSLAIDARSEDGAWNLVALRAAAAPDERVFGVGEQVPHQTLDLRGRSIPVIVQEGGVGRGRQPISAGIEAVAPGSSGSEDSTYYAAPIYVTSTTRALLLLDDAYSVFDFTGPDAHEVMVFAPALRARIPHGRSPLELIERLTEYTGRMPEPPAWLDDGAIVALARPLDDGLAIVDRLLDHGAALSAVWNQTWSGTARTWIGEQVLWNWVADEARRPGWEGWTRDLEDRGLRTLCYVNSMFRELPQDGTPARRDLFAEGMQGGYFVRGEDGEVLLSPVTAFDVALLDLTNEDARRWMKDVLAEEMMDRARCSGWMADFAEALPFEAVLADGRSGADFHNTYPVEWARLNREAVEEAGRMGDVLVFNRSGHLQTPRWSMLLWQGDQLTTWDEYDGLRSAVRGLIGGGFSGIALNHSDIGGYTSLSVGGVGFVRERELLERWSELAAFTAVMRTHEGNQPDANAQVYSDEQAMEHFARMTRLHRALAGYRRTLFAEAEARGWPVVRHLAMHHPDVDEAWAIDDEFLLGADVLVAPVLEKCPPLLPCAPEREVFLPPGPWVHLWSGDVYGHEVETARVRVAAPVGQPAVFTRQGSAIDGQIVALLAAEGIEAGAGGAGSEAAGGPTEAGSDADGYDGVFACGGEIAGTTVGGATALDAYSCNVGSYAAPERTFRFVAPAAGPVTFRLVDPAPMQTNHDVMVLADDGTCVAWGANAATFDADPGATYRLVVDGYDHDEGPFRVAVDCS
jgi:alpha-glucosidase